MELCRRSAVVLVEGCDRDASCITIDGDYHFKVKSTGTSDTLQRKPDTTAWRI
jgi:hypothetical protein